MRPVSLESESRSSMGKSAASQDSRTLGIEVYLDRFLAAWRNSKGLSGSRLPVVFFSGLTFLCAATAFIGAVPTRVFGHDIFIPLDAGWRIINGQRPHLDFVSGWGPVWFLVEGLGLKVSRYSVDGIGYANAIMACLVGTWCFFLGKDRLASIPRIGLGWYLAALVAAPYPLGITPLWPSHAMAYNRYGYALLGLILLECLSRVHDSQESSEAGWTGGFSTGVALSLALFLKASYFFVAVVLIGVLALLLGRLVLRRLIAIVVGFLLVSTSILAYLRFDVTAVLGDLRMAGASRAGALDARTLISKASTQWPTLLVMMIFVLATTSLSGNWLPSRWRDLRLGCIGALIVLADIGLMSTNAQPRGFPLCAVFAVLVINEIFWQRLPLTPTQAQSSRSPFAVALGLGALLFVPQFMSDIVGVAYGVWSKEKLRNGTEAIQFTSPDLKDLHLYDFSSTPQSNGTFFVDYVNDGVALLQSQTRPDETIISIDMTNPFSYALQRRPARAGIESPTYHFNIDDDHRPSDDRFFGDADIVMVPKRPALDAYYFLDFYRAYEPGLKQRYYLAAESPLWWMYRRK
jgi:hypothetical protein